MWPWVSHMSSLGLSLLICKMKGKGYEISSGLSGFIVPRFWDPRCPGHSCSAWRWRRELHVLELSSFPGDRSCCPLLHSCSGHQVLVTEQLCLDSLAAAVGSGSRAICLQWWGYSLFSVRHNSPMNRSTTPRFAQLCSAQGSCPSQQLQLAQLWLTALHLPLGSGYVGMGAGERCWRGHLSWSCFPRLQGGLWMHPVLKTLRFCLVLVLIPIFLLFMSNEGFLKSLSPSKQWLRYTSWTWSWNSIALWAAQAS